MAVSASLQDTFTALLTIGESPLRAWMIALTSRAVDTSTLRTGRPHSAIYGMGLAAAEENQRPSLT